MLHKRNMLWGSLQLFFFFLPASHLDMLAPEITARKQSPPRDREILTPSMDLHLFQKRMAAEALVIPKSIYLEKRKGITGVQLP